MNTKQNAIESIEEFLHSDERCLLITGTHQYAKHKLIMAILDKHFEHHLFLFRTNSLKNVSNNDHLGWAGVNKTPKAGETFKVGRNMYQCDSLTSSGTWYKTSRRFACAIVYPVDTLYRSGDVSSIDDLFKFKEISKVFLASWMDRNEYDHSIFAQFVQRHVVYDAEQEDPEYHQRVLNLRN